MRVGWGLEAGLCCRPLGPGECVLLAASIHTHTHVCVFVPTVIYARYGGESKKWSVRTMKYCLMFMNTVKGCSSRLARAFQADI